MVAVTPRLPVAAVVPRGEGNIARILVEAEGVIFRARLVGATLPFEVDLHDSPTESLLLPMSTKVGVEGRRVEPPTSLVVDPPPSPASKQ